jgi:DNA-binding NtrC family response regulator
MDIQKPRILIIEDDYALTRNLETCIKKFGYDVSGIVFADGEVVIQIEDTLPDLILMNLGLSVRINRIEAAKQTHLLNSVPVVYIAGELDLEELPMPKHAEVFEYISKPFDFREVEIVVAAALYKSRKEQELTALSNLCHSYLEKLSQKKL